MGFIRTGEHVYPAKDLNCEIKFFSSPPDKPYEEVAILTMHGDYSNVTYYIPNLRKTACELGGDAVILGGLTRTTSGYVYNHGFATALHSNDGQAVLIRFKK